MEIRKIIDDKQILQKFVDLQCYCFNLDRDIVEFELDKMFGKDESIILGGFLDNQLQGSLIINDFNIYWNGLNVKMGGIGGVTTFPEARQNHVVSQLLIESLEIMNENNQIFSLLAPFSFSFYRKYGWEYGTTTKAIELDINGLSHFKSQGYALKPIGKEHIQTAKQVYEKYYSSYNGTSKRTDLRWDVTFERNLGNKVFSYGVFDDDDTLRGYIFYKLIDNQFVVREMVYDSLKVRKQLLYFIYVHRAQVEKVKFVMPENDKLDMILTNQKLKMVIEPYMMVRVINVKKALEMFPFRNVQILDFSIGIEDKYASWNNTVFEVKVDDDKIQVTENENGKPDISCSIQVFSQIIFGFLSVEEAFNLELISCEDIDIINKLNECIPKKCTYITDGF